MKFGFNPQPLKIMFSERSYAPKYVYKISQIDKAVDTEGSLMFDSMSVGFVSTWHKTESFWKRDFN